MWVIASFTFGDDWERPWNAIMAVTVAVLSLATLPRGIGSTASARSGHERVHTCTEALVLLGFRRS
jgi:hypothetical protein